MEDIKGYMESGVLELYVLGDVSPEEKDQVEAMAAAHPAIKAELKEIERSMERYAAHNAVEPSADLRSRILNSVLTNLGDDTTFKSKTPEVKNNVIALPAQRAGNFYKYAFAACLALLLASTVVIINLNSRLQQSNTQLAVLQSSNQHFTNRVNLLDQQLEIFRDPSFKLLKLTGTPKSPASSLTVAWSPSRRKVLIDLGTVKMAQNDKDHQYQLWALVAGKPVDLGVFDTSPDSTSLKQMKSTALADAFAVTLEPRGGSVNPTMDQMVVVGKF